VISSIELQNFKGFRHLKLSELGPFHVLVGANGSGKSSFFEVFEFIKDLLLFDVQEAVSRRNVGSLQELTFDRRGASVYFDVMIEDTGRYQLSLSESADAGVDILSESLLVGPASGKAVRWLW
jgi:predicted ATPase